MKPWHTDLQVAFIAFCVIILGIVWFSCAWGETLPEGFYVTRVLDGDTVQGRSANGDVTVRLWGIDAPEHNQPGGHEAKRLLTQWLAHCPCVLQVRGHDRYGRVTAQLATPSGRDIGEQMIVQGWAMWDKRYAPQATAYGLAEIEARARRHGMWTTPAPIPPWQWRQGVRELSLKKSS